MKLLMRAHNFKDGASSAYATMNYEKKFYSEKVVDIE